MESLLNNIILHISQEMPSILTVDEDYGQLEALNNENKDMYPLRFPAVLLDVTETEWSNISDLAQQGECRVRVRLLIDCYEDTHAGSPTTDKVMQREETRKALHRLLQGFRASQDGALIRTESKFFTWNHGIKVYESTYVCRVSEAIAERATIPSKKLGLHVHT